MKCRVCGREIEDDTLFCKYCGAEQKKKRKRLTWAERRRKNEAETAEFISKASLHAEDIADAAKEDEKSVRRFGGKIRYVSQKTDSGARRIRGPGDSRAGGTGAAALFGDKRDGHGRHRLRAPSRRRIRGGGFCRTAVCGTGSRGDEKERSGDKKKSDTANLRLCCATEKSIGWIRQAGAPNAEPRGI